MHKFFLHFLVNKKTNYLRASLAAESILSLVRSWIFSAGRYYFFGGPLLWSWARRQSGFSGILCVSSSNGCRQKTIGKETAASECAARRNVKLFKWPVGVWRRLHGEG
jgi:hypothetical protein